MAEIPDDMIYEMADGPAPNIKCPVVKIDRYEGPMGWGGGGGHSGGHLSVGSANESNHDDYISEFMEYVYEFIQASGMNVKDSMNVILSTRNGDNGRDRMAAAKRCMSIAPQLRIIRPFFEARGFEIRVDSYNFRNIWLPFLGVSMDPICLDIEDPKQIGVGSGDGYHRYFGE
ncbi:MAG: hypothetical protein ACXADD_20045, partial [Candidatus Thorarchaeota archaeon]